MLYLFYSISNFSIRSSTSNNRAVYEYSCLSIAQDNFCSTRASNLFSCKELKDSPNIELSCGDKEAMKTLKLVPEESGKWKYEFRCCEISSKQLQMVYEKRNWLVNVIGMVINAVVLVAVFVGLSDGGKKIDFTSLSSSASSSSSSFSSYTSMKSSSSSSSASYENYITLIRYNKIEIISQRDINENMTVRSDFFNPQIKFTTKTQACTKN
jgi:hypothetical protein